MTIIFKKGAHSHPTFVIPAILSPIMLSRDQLIVSEWKHESEVEMSLSWIRFPCAHTHAHAHTALCHRENCLCPESQVLSRKPSSHPTPEIKSLWLTDSDAEVKWTQLQERWQTRRSLKLKCDAVKTRFQEKTAGSLKSKGGGWI